MSEENVETARRLIDAFNHHDVAAIIAELDPEIEWIEDRRYPGAETFHGPAGVERSMRKWWDAWELEVEAEELIDLGHQIVVVGTATPGAAAATSHSRASSRRCTRFVTTDWCGLTYSEAAPKHSKLRGCVSRRGSRRGAPSLSRPPTRSRPPARWW